MSTSWYLECMAPGQHPGFRSEEVEQHDSGLKGIERVIRAFPALQAVAEFDFDAAQALDDGFQRAAYYFLREHPMCPLELVSEYGERRSVER